MTTKLPEWIEDYKKGGPWSHDPKEKGLKLVEALSIAIEALEYYADKYSTENYRTAKAAIGEIIELGGNGK